MKIRIKGNSVRYRVSKSEVALLAQTGRLEETTEFPAGRLIYAICRAEGAEMEADCSAETITLRVPRELLRQWAETDQVGMERDMPLPGGGSLYLLLEKDFKCIDGDVTEDQSDYFENPHIVC